MTTPNTLKASLTADVGAAQVQIQRLIKTVEDMGKTVNATSAAGQKAFKAEADEVARLVRELGASERQLTQLTNARTSFNSRVKSESMAAANAAAQMATAHGNAAKDVVKGLGSIAAEAKITAGGLKDILTGVGSLAFAFGPQGAFVAAVAIGASTIVGLFTSAREEMEKTQREFTDRIRDMQSAGNARGLRDEAKKIFDELQPLQARLAQAQDRNFGGLTVGEGLRARRVLPAQIAALQERFNEVRGRALLPGAPDIASSQLQGVTVTADAPGRRPSGSGSSRPSNLTPSMVEASEGLRGLTSGIRDALGAVPTGDDSPFTMIANDAARTITPMTVLRAEIASTKDALKDMGMTGRFALEDAIGAGLDTLITGRGNALQAIKRAAAEPIVAELRMTAIRDAAKAASFAASFNFPAAGIALASATKNALGAVAVARIGGIGGGGGDGPSAGVGGGDPSFGRGASLSGEGLNGGRGDRPMKIEMVIVTRTPDGRELSRTRQQIQRLNDRNQPIRVTL